MCKYDVICVKEIKFLKRSKRVDISRGVIRLVYKIRHDILVMYSSRAPCILREDKSSFQFAYRLSLTREGAYKHFFILVSLHR